MKFWKKALLTIAALTVSTSTGVTSVSAASSAVNSELVHKGKLTISLEGAYSPYSYRKNNKLTDFEVGLGKTVAKEMGLKVNFVPIKWDSLIAGLGLGKFSVATNNITQTPERAKQCNFSTPYIKLRFALVVPTDNNIGSLKDIKGRKIIAGIGTNSANVVKEYKGSLTPNGDFASSSDMIKQDRAAGTVNSHKAWYTYNKENNTKGLKMTDVSNEQDPAKVSALFNKKGIATRPSYNKAPEELRQDGTVRKLSEKYFGADITE